MNIDNKAILDSVLETLRKDETLSSYVKKISHGHMEYSRKQYPFIDVGNFHIRPERMNAGSIYLLYTIELIAGTNCLTPVVAYKGSESGARGINELCDDICEAIRGQDFNKIFSPVYRISSNPNFRRNKGETTHIGIVTFTARHWTEL